MKVSRLKIHVYTDGSLNKFKGNHWPVGGFGVWWPSGREEAKHQPGEDEYNMMHIQEEEKGVKMWNIFNAFQGSSTRTEIGGLMGSMLSAKAIHAGIDNLAVVRGVNRITKHMRLGSNAVLKNVEGAQRLGGRLSPLHREPVA